MPPVEVGPYIFYLGEGVAAFPALTPAEEIALKQEDARQWIAAGLIALLAAIVVTGLLTFAIGGDDARLAHTLQFTFGPIVALIGTVAGFYFGSKNQE